MRSKKGQTVDLSTLLPVVVTFAVAILALGLISGVTEDVRQSQISSFDNNIQLLSGVNPYNTTLTLNPYNGINEILNNSGTAIINNTMTEGLDYNLYLIGAGTDGAAAIVEVNGTEITDAIVNYSTVIRTADYNSTNGGIVGMQNLSGQFGNIGTVIAIVVIIGLLVGAFAVMRQ